MCGMMINYFNNKYNSTNLLNLDCAKHKIGRNHSSGFNT